MPYISNDKRLKYNTILDHLEHIPEKGELEYCIYKLMKIYMHNKEFRYSTLHDTVYAAQHCADEFRRVYLNRREDQAKDSSGPIYPLLQIED